MKKVIYIFGSIEIICGLLLLSTAAILKEAFPLLGRLAFQVAMKGGFSPNDYTSSFFIVTVLGIVFLVLGGIQLFLALTGKIKE